MSDPLAHLPGYALRRAAYAMMSELGNRLAKVGLRVTDASVLMVVGGGGEVTSSEIGRTLDIQRANMVPLLSRLETSGLIARRPIDRKSSAIELTDSGRAKLAEVQRITSAFEEELMARVPDEHRPHLVPALNALWQD